MKKIFSVISLLLISMSAFMPYLALAQNETGYFVVTAYYSPLPDQKYYYMGNYEAEIKLNGRGTNGASGKEVFSGMLAAPATYEFGTKIYLEGLGIGDVQDRGGAIVSAGNRGYEHDRIDVWMGYGDEGLARALAWGKKTIKGYTVHASQPSSIDISKLPAPELPEQVIKQHIPAVFEYSLGKGSDALKVIELQEFFTEIGLYDGEINGLYNNKIISIVYDYQIENGIVSSDTDEGAGYWGKNTRDKFKEDYLLGKYEKEETEILTDNEEQTEEKIIMESMAELNLEVFDRALTHSAQQVRNVQEVMKDLGLYDGEITGNSKDITKSIYNYQITKGIIINRNSAGAGQFGPKTRDAMKVDYLAHLEVKAEEEKVRIEQELIQKQEEERIKQEEKQRLAYEAKKEQFENQLEELKLKGLELAKEKVDPIRNVQFGESSVNVRHLQLLLKEFGYFDEKDTAIFGEKTKQALMNFQADNDIIFSKNDDDAGVMSAKTVDFIVKRLTLTYVKEEVKGDEDFLKYIIETEV